MEVKPGYKQTEVGVIPEDWEVENISNSFEICNQLRMPISQTNRKRMAGPYPYYGPTNIQGWINEYRIDGEYALIGEDGDHFLKWKSHPMTLLVRGKFNVNNHAHLVRGIKNSTEWFYWFFINRDITQFLTRQGASRYKLTKASLVQLPCALPPPAEQRAIASALSDVDGLLDGLERLIAKKRDLKQAAMQQLLTGQTRLPGFQGEWQKKAIHELAKVGRGRVISHVEISKASSPAYPVFSSQTSNSGIMGYLDSYDFEGDYVTWTTDGANAGTVFARSGRFNCTNVCGTIKLHNSDHCFIAAALGRVSQAHVSRHLGNPKLMNDVMNKIEIIVPKTQDEQSAIAEVLTGMDAELAALEARLEKTRSLKQAMMQELLTGRTRLI